MTMIEKSVRDKHADLKTLRQPFEATWQELAKYFNPYREGIFLNDPSWNTMGKYLFDSTGVSSVRLLAEGLFGYLMSPALDWFRLEIANNEDLEIKFWLEDTVVKLYAALRRSNFYSDVVEFLTDGITFGTGVMYFEENLGDGNTFFKVIPPDCVWIDEDGYGRIQRVFRRDRYSKIQATEKFGCEDLEGKFIHAVLPDQGKFRSVWYHEHTGTIVRESHYDSFPYIIWRCIRNPQSAYGFSPALMALPTVKTLNKIKKSLLEAAQLAVKPPLNAPVNTDVDRTPNGINYYEDPTKLVTSVNLGINFPIGKDREEAIQKTIRDFFNIDFFLMFAHQERAMTATEVMERQGEKAAMLGNIVGRLTNELLDRVVEGTLTIELMAGRLTDPPEALGDKWVDVEYLGPLAVAQKKLFESKGLNYALSGVAPILEMNPESMLNFDWDYLTRYAYTVSGAPVKGLVPLEDVEKKRMLELMKRAEENANVEE